jgi:hypothetical protein
METAGAFGGPIMPVLIRGLFLREPWLRRARLPRDPML